MSGAGGQESAPAAQKHQREVGRGTGASRVTLLCRNGAVSSAIFGLTCVPQTPKRPAAALCCIHCGNILCKSGVGRELAGQVLHGPLNTRRPRLRRHFHGQRDRQRARKDTPAVGSSLGGGDPGTGCEVRVLVTAGSGAAGAAAAWLSSGTLSMLTGLLGAAATARRFLLLPRLLAAIVQRLRQPC